MGIRVRISTPGGACVRARQVVVIGITLGIDLGINTRMRART